MRGQWSKSVGAGMRPITRWEKHGDLLLLLHRGWKCGVIWSEDQRWLGVAPFGEPTLKEFRSPNLRRLKAMMVASCNKASI